MNAPPRNDRKGFTLVELLVVIAIIGLLVGLLLPAVQKVRAAAQKTACENNLKQLGVALHSYADTKKQFPGNLRPDPASTVRSRWLVRLLPYLERNDLYSRYDFSINWDAGTNAAVVKEPLKIVICPSSPNPERIDGNPDKGWANAGTLAAGTPPTATATPAIAVGDYSAVYGVYGDFITANSATLPGGTVQNPEGILSKTTAITFADITDGTSNTIYLVESAGKPFLYQAGTKQGNNWRAKGVNGGGWCRPASDIWVFGSTKDGTAIGGAFTVNATNGFDHGGAYPLTIGTPALNTEPSGQIYGFHTGGAYAVFADGSVRFIDEGINAAALAALVTRANNDIVPPQ